MTSTITFPGKLLANKKFYKIGGTKNGNVSYRYRDTTIEVHPLFIQNY